jgi:methionyl-tRNA synthetase
MGKTLGNVIEVDVLHRYFQIDAVRYFLLREMVFGQDGKFSYGMLIDRANADLASGLGNLASRTFSMINKYRNGAIPSGKIGESGIAGAKQAGLEPNDKEHADFLAGLRDEYLQKFDKLEFSNALELLWTAIARVDKLISDSKPWELIKDDSQSEALNAVLYRASETLRWLCVLVHPVMPESSQKIYSQIGIDGVVSEIDPETLVWGGLEPGTNVGAAEAVFPRIDKGKIMTEIKEQSKARVTDGNQSGSSDAVPTRPAETELSDEQDYISIDDFLKVELRVGEIKVAERVPNADKLLRFEIDLGEDKPRQILAGLAEYYEPEKLVGRKVVVVANLRPRKMRGLESQGMICAASLTQEDTPALATFAEDVLNGARLK